MSGPWCLLVLKICFSEETKNANSVSSSSLREMLRAVMVGLFLWVCRFYSESSEAKIRVTHSFPKQSITENY